MSALDREVRSGADGFAGVTSCGGRCGTGDLGWFLWGIFWNSRCPCATKKDKTAGRARAEPVSGGGGRDCGCGRRGADRRWRDVVRREAGAGCRGGMRSARGREWVVGAGRDPPEGGSGSSGRDAIRQRAGADYRGGMRSDRGRRGPSTVECGRSGVGVGHWRWGAVGQRGGCGASAVDAGRRLLLVRCWLGRQSAEGSVGGSVSARCLRRLRSSAMSCSSLRSVGSVLAGW